MGDLGQCREGDADGSVWDQECSTAIYHCSDEDPNYDFENWEEMAINCVPLNGLVFESDTKTVHLFLMNNISKDSDAYAYIQPLILRNGGQQDWKALEECYENSAAI